MATAIQADGEGGKNRDAKRKARQVWTQLQPATWDTLTAAQRWEIVRRVLVFVIRREFRNLE